LLGTAQLTATVAPNGRSSTSAPAAAPSVSVSPPLVSTRAPAVGAIPLTVPSRGRAGTESSAIASSASAL
jgi:hypothetical protein